METIAHFVIALIVRLSGLQLQEGVALVAFGVFLMGAAVILLLLSLCVSFISGRKLKRKLEAEYGKRWP